MKRVVGTRPNRPLGKVDTAKFEDVEDDEQIESIGGQPRRQNAPPTKSEPKKNGFLPQIVQKKNNASSSPQPTNKSQTSSIASTQKKEPDSQPFLRPKQRETGTPASSRKQAPPAGNQKSSHSVSHSKAPTTTNSRVTTRANTRASNNTSRANANAASVQDINVEISNKKKSDIHSVNEEELQVQKQEKIEPSKTPTTKKKDIPQEKKPSGFVPNFAAMAKRDEVERDYSEGPNLKPKEKEQQPFCPPKSEIRLPSSDAIVICEPVDASLGKLLKLLLLGSPQRTFGEDWRLQAFSFVGDLVDSPVWGLWQQRIGPCAAVAAVQAELLRFVMFDEFKSEKFSDTTSPEKSGHGQNTVSLTSCTKEIRRTALVSALATMICRCRGTDAVAAEDEPPYVVVLPCARRVYFTDDKVKEDGVTEKLLMHRCRSPQDVFDLIASRISQFESSGSPGVICLIYSMLLTRTIAVVARELCQMIGYSSGDVFRLSMLTQLLLTEDSFAKPFIDQSGGASDHLVNFLLTGVVVAYFFNDDLLMPAYETTDDAFEVDSRCSDTSSTIDDGESGQKRKEADFLTLKGIHQRSDIGLLSINEYDSITAVGSCYKTPRFPIWLGCGRRRRWVVIFSPSRSLTRDWRAERNFDLVVWDAYFAGCLRIGRGALGTLCGTQSLTRAKLKATRVVPLNRQDNEGHDGAGGEEDSLDGEEILRRYTSPSEACIRLKVTTIGLENDEEIRRQAKAARRPKTAIQNLLRNISTPHPAKMRSIGLPPIGAKATYQTNTSDGQDDCRYDDETFDSDAPDDDCPVPGDNVAKKRHHGRKEEDYYDTSGEKVEDVEEEEEIPTCIDLVIGTKWPGAHVDWNGIFPHI